MTKNELLAILRRDLELTEDELSQRHMVLDDMVSVGTYSMLQERVRSLKEFISKLHILTPEPPTQE